MVHQFNGGITNCLSARLGLGCSLRNLCYVVVFPRLTGLSEMIVFEDQNSKGRRSLEHKNGEGGLGVVDKVWRRRDSKNGLGTRMLIFRGRRDKDV